jgi:hypothetical protein
MKEKKAISNVVVVIIVSCAVVIGIGSAVYFASNGGVETISPKGVTVAGTVTAAVAGTFEKITFTGLSNGVSYVVGANGETYSISLPDGDSYNVTIAWKLFGTTGGNAILNWNEGTLNLDTTRSSVTENWAIPNPSTP